MKNAEISQLIQITLEILKVDGGYGGGINISNKSRMFNTLYLINIVD